MECPAINDCEHVDKEFCVSALHTTCAMQNKITVRERQLPDSIEDLSKFVLVGREKLSSVRAEIRAIDKLQLAEEVRNQKKEEALMLSEALLDAEVKLGDLLKNVPTAPGMRSDIKEPTDTAVHRLQKTKKEVVSDLGFSEKQAQRFETLADNKDLVEQVKAEARENDDIPTRTRVLDLAKERRRVEAEKQTVNDEYSAYIDRCAKTAKRFTNLLYDMELMEVTDTTLLEWKELLDNNVDMISDYAGMSTRALAKIQKINQFLRRCEL